MLLLTKRERTLTLVDSNPASAVKEAKQTEESRDVVGNTRMPSIKKSRPCYLTTKGTTIAITPRKMTARMKRLYLVL